MFLAQNWYRQIKNHKIAFLHYMYHIYLHIEIIKLNLHIVVSDINIVKIM